MVMALLALSGILIGAFVGAAFLTQDEQTE